MRFPRHHRELSPPSQAPIPSTAIINRPFDQAWDGFIRKVSQSFFVVNNLSKESRLINISVGQSRAGEFIDCGNADDTVNSKPWSFNPAKDATFTDRGFRSETVVYHRVKGSGGRLNIFVAPDGPERTVFEVNATFSLDMRQSGRDEVRNLLGQVVSQRDLLEESALFQFTTKQPDRKRSSWRRSPAKRPGSVNNWCSIWPDNRAT